VKMIFRADGHRESAQGMRRPAWAGVNAQVCGAGDITAIKTERRGFPPRRSRESGNPDQLVLLGPRFRGDDEEK
ncbi:hypothetical protein, partial [Ferrovibrio sp.]|uniref:hypothetical protein n=1 Tax=Ferrovibrio sp. TaxID=1917215 RepID=UPI003513FA21